MKARAIIAAVVAVAALGTPMWAVENTPTAPPAPQAATYVGSAACGDCHQQQLSQWRGSHHDRAMQAATKATVVANFDNTTFSKAGVTTSFSRDGDHYRVKAQGADGQLRPFDIAYTFGVTPLQQYLIAFPGGAYQALTTAWDSRPKEQGGQRWFDLYPNEKTPPGDVLHWTGPANTWNRMCADCHSTNLRNGYIAGERRYETTWSDLNVGCEACHGPGSQHIAWAKARTGGSVAPGANVGFALDLVDRSGATWVQSGDTGIAHRSQPRTSHAELDTCAPCHSRRQKIATPQPGGKFLDAYQPTLLDEGMYFADGQMQDEVYVWGSFVQSKMFRAGVTCGDCHDPHNLRLRADGNAVCGKCHVAAKFDSPAHHHHPSASTGARCVACHMPARTYMIVDPRHDHRFGIPRPDLSGAIGAPNACAACHGAQTSEWAAKTIASWNSKAPTPHFGAAIDAGRRLGHNAAAELVKLIADREQPAIARATALDLLPPFAFEDLLPAIQGAAADSEPLVRAAAATAAMRLPAQARPQLVQALLDDPIRLVRIEAGRALVGSRSLLDADASKRFDRVLIEMKQAHELNADQPQAHVALGTLYAEMGMTADAERAYKTALEVGAYFIPAYVNLADLYRMQGREAEAEATLREGLKRSPDDASLHHSLGLTLVRLGRKEDALAELKRAHEIASDDVRYAYVYAVALNSFDRRDESLRILETMREKHPANADVLIALSTMQRDAGDKAKARQYAEQLRAEWPNSRAARELLQSLQ